jgi:CRP-like cAMP-binding protein
LNRGRAGVVSLGTPPAPEVTMHGTDIHTLARLPLLRGSSRRQLMLVDRLTTALEVPPERVLCQQGEPGQHFYVIVKGRAAVMRDGRLVALLGRGDWFGELAFTQGDGRRTATVTAVTGATVLVFGRVGYRTLLEANPQAAARIAERARTRAGMSRATDDDVSSLAG